jgi:hypothetical protein
VLAALFIGSVVGLVGALIVLALVSPAPATAADAGALAGFIAGLIAYVALMAIIVVTFLDRCLEVKGRSICAAGGVLRIEENDKPSTAESLFPFTMMHDRVDVVTQSRHWEDIERDEAFVFCTSDPAPETSEILRCYYYDPQICAAGAGAVIGGAALGIGGLLAGTFAAAAIGCATIVFCILALLVAVIFVVAAVLLGAAIGSNIGRAVSEDRGPPAGIALGDYVAVRGNLRKRGFDLDANVLWWTMNTNMSGTTGSLGRSTHCDINDLPPLCD